MDMNLNFQRISPLWEAFPGREIQPAESAEKTVGSSFADIFNSLINNVRETEDDVAKKEYMLSTGQLDNPAELTMSLYKAETAMALMVQLREKALSAYSELSRITL